MKQTAPRNYLAITVDPAPAVWLITEEQVREKVVQSSPIYHSWLRKAGAGIVGVRFSSWMINHGFLSRREKDVVTGWNRGEGDFEVFFGPEKEYDSDTEPDEEVRHTCLVKLEKDLLGVSLPLFGPALAKQEVARLEETLIPWAKPAPEPEAGGEGQEGEGSGVPSPEGDIPRG